MEEWFIVAQELADEALKAEKKFIGVMTRIDEVPAPANTIFPRI